MKSHISFLLLVIISGTACAEYTLNSIPTDFVLSYEATQRADTQDDLGLLGTSMNFNVYNGLYIGPSIYSAIQSDLGGLFVIGANTGYKHSLYDKLWGDIGYFAGGGGAHNDVNPDFSGFMSRSHIGMEYHFTYVELGLQYVYLNYPGYGIHDYHVAFTFSVPGHILMGDPSYRGTSATSLDGIFSNQGINFYRIFLSMFQESYYLHNAKDENGDDLNDTMQLAGAKGGVFLTPSIYLGITTSGAYDSSKSGYMDFFTLLGYQHHLSPKLFYTVEGAIGSGGGGNTDTGSGLMYKPSVGLGYSLTQALALILEGGYIIAPSGEFQGTVTSLSLNYQFYNASPESFVSNIGDGYYTFSGWKISAQTETYHNPQRLSESSTVEDIDMAVIEISHEINDTWLVKGQAAGAYGGNAGSYATGLIGAGVQSPLWHDMRLLSNFFIGAAGGGDVDVGRGAIYQPEAGVSYDITPYISLTAKIGRIRSIDGALDATTYSAGIVFNFTSLQEGI